MSSLTFPAMIDALKVQLDAREGIADSDEVAVYTGPMPAGHPYPRRAIVFHGAEVTVKPASIGPVTMIGHQEEYTVTGACFGGSPLAGEEGIKAARDQALAAVEHVHQQLRTDPTVNHTVTEAHFDTGKWDQGTDGDQGRVCKVEFTVAVQARI